MKKSAWFAWISGLFAVFMTELVSAQARTAVGRAFENLFQGITDIIQPILQYIIGPASGEVFWGKLLLMVLLFALSYSVLKNVKFFSETPWALWTISIVISILGIRFLTEQMVIAAILPSSALGITISAGLPFVIFFLFVEVGLKAPDHAPIIRRTAWLFYAVVFIALYAMRASEMGNIAWVYPATAVLALIMAFMDGTIQGFFIRARVQRIGASYRGSGALTVQKKIADITAVYNSGSAAYQGGVHTAKSAGKTGTEAYLADLAYLEKELAKFLR